MQARAVPAPMRVSAALLIALAGLSGCASSTDANGPAAGTSLRGRDFKGETPAPRTAAPGSTRAPVAAATGDSGTAAARPPLRAATITPEQASGGIGRVALLAGEPEGQVSAAARPAEGPLLVDALVGQINGKPVYASKFLAPLDGRLRAKAVELKNNRLWQREAGRIIYDTLIDQVRDELFLAEARAGLSPEQRQGLFAFVEQLRRNLASQNFGSAELAEERTREREGVSVDKKIADERDQALIRTLVSQKVNPRVNISWRDIQRRYERDAKLYNPSPVANIRMIWVARSNADAAAKVAGLLAASKPFVEVASGELNEFSANEGGLIERVFEAPYGSGRLWEDNTLNDNARTLTVGATVGPFTYQTFQVWMHLDSITQRPGKSLEEAQLEISNRLRNEKFNEETNRLFARILERGSRTNERDMTERLLLIASERYLLPQAAQ